MTLIDDFPMYTKDNRDVRRVVIQSDDVPTTFPFTGEGVTGLPDNVVIAPTSMIHCVDTGKNYFLKEDGSGWKLDGEHA